MELFLELLFTISFSLLVSLLIAKLFSMASDCDVAGGSIISASKSIIFEEKNNKESVICDAESEEKVQDFEELVKVNDHEEEESRFDKFDNKAILREIEVSGLAEKDMAASVCKGGAEKVECEKEETESVGGDELAENVVDKSSDTVSFREIEIQSFEESPERSNFHQIEIGLVKGNEVPVVEGEISMGNESDEVNIEERDNGEEEGLFDDWEGIERTELEKGFGAAVAFVGSKSNADRISLLNNEVKMQLYGFHKVAIEGHCCEPQPMVLKVSARANWNAWKRLGDISPEDAMEQYISLLSRNIPDWMGDDSSEASKQSFLVSGTSWKLEMQSGAEIERKTEQLKHCIEECSTMGVEDPNFIDRDKQ